jgi:hypothetical protein
MAHQCNGVSGFRLPAQSLWETSTSVSEALPEFNSLGPNPQLLIALHSPKTGYRPFVILEPNRIFDRKTCNDIDCHVVLLIRGSTILPYEVFQTGCTLFSISEQQS